MYPPKHCCRHSFHHCWTDGSWLMTVGKKKDTGISNIEMLFSVNKTSSFYSQMCSLCPGGETRQREKQDDCKVAILMTCDVWLVMASAAYVCFSFDMLFSL